MTIEIATRNAEETRDLGRRLGALCQAGQVIGLHGNLGAGKTVFAQGVGLGLGVLEPVSSPTFNLAQHYLGAVPLWHLDAYRLASAEDLDDLSWEELLSEPAVIVVEWAERIAAALPEDRLDVHLAATDAETRTARLSACGPRSEALLSELQEQLHHARTSA